MHWGHTVSEDLVHWEYQGIALFPTKEYDQNGVFSGTALEEDGKLKIYYSAVKYLKPNPEDVHRVLDDAIQTSQAMIVSEDGFILITGIKRRCCRLFMMKRSESRR